MKKALTIIVAVALMATFSVNIFAEENDSVLYYMVDCGDRSLNTVAEGDTLGVYQSVTEQLYGADPVTGKTWGIVDGLRESDEDGALRTTWTNVCGNDGDAKEFTGRWIQDMKQNGLDRVVTYKFEVPNGEYEVEVGLVNMWSCAGIASVAVDGGNTWNSGETLLNSNIDDSDPVKKSGEVATVTATVTDGELDVVITAGEQNGEQIDMIVVTYITVTGAAEAEAPATSDTEAPAGDADDEPAETPDEPTAPQTGFATVAIALVAAISAGYVVSKKH